MIQIQFTSSQLEASPGFLWHPVRTGHATPYSLETPQTAWESHSIGVTFGPGLASPHGGGRGKATPCAHTARPGFPSVVPALTPLSWGPVLGGQVITVKLTLLQDGGHPRETPPAPHIFQALGGSLWFETEKEGRTSSKSHLYQRFISDGHSGCCPLDLQDSQASSTSTHPGRLWPCTPTPSALMLTGP